MVYITFLQVDESQDKLEVQSQEVSEEANLQDQQAEADTTNEQDQQTEVDTTNEVNGVQSQVSVSYQRWILL